MMQDRSVTKSLRGFYVLFAGILTAYVIWSLINSYYDVPPLSLVESGCLPKDALTSKASDGTTTTTTTTSLRRQRPRDVSTVKNGGNRTLVVALGNLRCGELAWQTLQQ